MLALKMMYYIYIYLQGKVFMVYYFFKTSSFLNSFIYFIYLFWLCWVFIAAWACL